MVNEQRIKGHRLSDWQLEIVKRLAEGKSNKQVADEMGISPRTIESHRNSIMRKMQFSNFSELVRFAVRRNLIPS